MAIKDTGSYYNLGFGIPPQKNVDEGPTGGDSNGLQKALNGHPVMRFFAVAAAAAIGMHVAGKVVREGGLRLAEFATKEAAAGSEVWKGNISSFRKIESYLDDLQGVSREYIDGNPENLVQRVGSKLSRETPTFVDDFNIRTSNLDADPSLSRWSIRHEMQQRLLTTARRLPYETPALYVAQKGLLDPLLGQGQKPKDKVNWHNPVDVIGDFSYQTIKNLAVNILPFDLGFGAAKVGYSSYALKAMQNPGANIGYLGVRTLLEQVGVDASNLMNQTHRMSKGSLGSFSMMIDDASNSAKPFKQFIAGQKNAAFTNEPEYKNSGFARRLWLQGKAIATNTDNSGLSAIDTLGGPFKGMGSAIPKIKQNYKNITQVHDDWQDLLQGKTRLEVLKKSADPERYARLIDYMRKGGGSPIEQYGKSIFDMGKGGPVLPNGKPNPEWRTGGFYNARRQDIYSELLSKELESAGLKPEHALQFLKQAPKVTPFPGARAQYSTGENLIDRFQFSKDTFHGKTTQDWWQTVTRGARAHGLPIEHPDKFTYDLFKQSVKSADLKFSTPGFKQFMDYEISSQWHNARETMLTAGGATISSAKKPYELFAGARLESSREFLVKKSAQRLGINLIDNAGNEIPINQVKQAIWNKGLNPDNLHTLRGYLVSQKEITSPLNAGGRNLFGFRQMTVEEAMNNQSYGANRLGQQNAIKDIVDRRTFGPMNGSQNRDALSVNRWDLKVNKTYVGPSGHVFDFGKIQRDMTFALDKFSSSYHIPLIKIKPGQVGGAPSFETMRNAPSVIYASGHSVQPIALAGGKEFEKPDFYLWLKSSANRAKGNVVGFSGNGFTKSVTSHKYEGLYRPLLTNPGTLVGKAVNALLGHETVPGSESQSKPWKRRFDVSNNQESNIFGGRDSLIARLYRGMTKKPDAFENPRIAAGLFSEPGFSPENLTESQSRGLEALIKKLRGSGFSGNTQRQLAQYPEFAGLLGLDNSLNINLANIPNNLLPDMVRESIKKDSANLAGMSREEAARFSRLQGPLKSLIKQGDSQVNFWDLTAPENIKTTGIATRRDQLVSEWSKYKILSTQITNNAGADFRGSIQNLLLKNEELFNKGLISATEKAEGRAAILSLQVEDARNMTYEPGADYLPFTHNQATLKKLFDNGVDVKGLLKDFSNDRVSKVGSRKAAFKASILDMFHAVPYRKIDEINPTGSNYTFMPTFGTVWNRNKWSALKGLGFNTRNAENLSGSSIPAMHLVSRLNKQFGTIGLELDPTKYKGAFDLYARGIVGKRILPLVAAGATALAVDSTLGGIAHKDKNGNPIYSPLVVGGISRGIVEAQSLAAGVIPGGMNYTQKRQELLHGEVPIRKGRFWLLGNTPLKGGRIEYFRPSWYQRLKAGASYTPEMNETPLERLAFGYDFSPLRPLDPYRRERQDYESRPYPITGDYFTGPWGPLTPILNATVGKVLKPHRRMHKEETAYGLSQYLPVGDSGAYFSPTPINPSSMSTGHALGQINSSYSQAGKGTPSSAPFYSSQGYAAPRGRASSMVRGNTAQIASSYSAMANSPARYSSGGGGGSSSGLQYGISNAGGMQPRVIEAQAPLDYQSTSVTARRIGYQVQEVSGIYGFAAGTIRSKLGFGAQDLSPNRSVLEPASRGYSASRSFWNLNLGGLGDVPLPLEGQFSNLEISEITRRFVPKEQSGIHYVNNIPNQLGKAFPWLPGTDYPLANLKSGDPYNTIPDAGIRLPGTGFNRTHQLYPDQYGKLGLANIHQILGDVAPWSNEYRRVDSMVNSEKLTAKAQARVEQTRAQVEAMRYENEFTPYKYKYKSILDTATQPATAVGRFKEWLGHRDTFINNKLGAPQTALEDWERNDVYGASYAKWSSPVQSFLKPAWNKSTQRTLLSGATSGGTLGYLFGATTHAKKVGSLVGGAIGLAAALYGKVYQKTTGDRFIPLDRRKEIALEENIDILQYSRAVRLANEARMQGNDQGASFWDSQSQKTMYGADLNGTPEMLVNTIPKRKREHFRAMLYAPPEEHQQILSTAGRLERRELEAAWGDPVEKRPDLKEYYESHELPPPDSDVWRPEVSMDNIKIKMGQAMGLDMSQMGFYPQQISEANLINPSYPDPNTNNTSFGFSIKGQLKRLLIDQGIQGQVRASPTPFNRDRTQLRAGVTS